MTGELSDIIKKYKNNYISSRELITKVKNNIDLFNEVNSYIDFIDSDDILEKLYYIINDLHEVVKCQYCDNKAKWTGRFKEGYKVTCCCKECESKRISEMRKGNTVISDNREINFKNWEKTIKYSKDINDDVIKEHIKYSSQVSLITNPVILKYLNNRFADSDSLLETYQRICLGVEKKPGCLECGRPVNWLGRKDRLYTKFCSCKCAQRNKLVNNNKKETLLKNYGTTDYVHSYEYREQFKKRYGVEYNSQRSDVIQKRKETLNKHFGTTKLYTVKEIRDKIKETNIKKFGYDSIFKNPEFREYSYEVCKHMGALKSSKAENKMYGDLCSLGYNVNRFKRSKEFPFCVDFYIPELDLYIEYNGSQFHNKRPYTGSPKDLKELEILKEKDQKRREITGKKTQYENIVKTWTIYDVNKRNFAAALELNFLEIYKYKDLDDLNNQINDYINNLDKWKTY